MLPAVIEHTLPFRGDPYVLSIHCPSLAPPPTEATAPAPSAQRQGSSKPALAPSASKLDRVLLGKQRQEVIAGAAQQWWPLRRFGAQGRYIDEMHKLQRWFGVDIFLTVRQLHTPRALPVHVDETGMWTGPECRGDRKGLSSPASRPHDSPDDQS